MKRNLLLFLLVALLLFACAKGEKAQDAQGADSPEPIRETPAPTAEATETPAPEETAVPVTEAPEKTEIAIPKDPRGSDLELKAEEWGGYVCLFPESFSVSQTSEDAIDAVAPDGQKTGLVEFAYAKYARVAAVSMLPEWYLNVLETVHDPAADGAGNDDFEIERGHEITAGFRGEYLRHRTEGYTICLCALYNAEDVLIFRGRTLSEDGVADFDSVVRRFVALDARRTADEMGEGINPFFTCTGTEYGRFPIIPPEERKAEALAFLNENRDALGQAAKTALETGKLTEIRDLLTGTQIYASLCQPEPVFVSDAAYYLELDFPRAIDTTYDDPGILYDVVLIYTTNTADQIDEWYRDALEPLDGNWYVETCFYAY